MAPYRKEIYGKYGIYGSNVYDFKSTGNESPGDYCCNSGSVSNGAAPRRARPSPAFGVACALCLVLLITGLVSRSGLVDLSQETYELRNEINTLVEEQTRLKIRHEMSFSLAETERYAIDVLGMQKPGPDQISYIELEKPSSENSEQENREEFDFVSIIREIFPG